MITTTCLIFWMPELPLDVWAGAGAGAPTPIVSAARAITPARLVTGVGPTRAILPTETRGSSSQRQRCAKSPEPNIGRVKAVRVVRHGAPTEVLEVQDIPVPDVGPGEVRIAVSAASLNFGDIARCRGTLASVQGQAPFTLGMDVCAVVDAVGPAADALAHAADVIVDRVMALIDDRGAEVVVDLIGGEETETIWTCVAREGRYLPVGYNNDPESGATGRPLRKVSMGNFSVLGVMLGYTEMPIEFRKFGINTFPPEVGREVHDALLALVAAGAIRPVIGRRISMHEVPGALDDHEQRRTSGRTVVDMS